MVIRFGRTWAHVNGCVCMSKAHQILAINGKWHINVIVVSTYVYVVVGPSDKVSVDLIDVFLVSKTPLSFEVNFETYLEWVYVRVRV